ncbi:hypothetical protein AB0A05_26860 [Streptomyces sp. NPDC046374]|uniref:hypothetical protein n=1 Tax=Streptomyces sp. NPDC046374 TaxID=3154917 RepID=UPI0033FE6924
MAITLEKKLSAEEIARQSWDILATPVHAEDADAVCANCGYGLVELPRPIRLKVTVAGIGGGYLAAEFMDFAHWADDEERIEDEQGEGWAPCSAPQPKECDGLSGTGCGNYVQLGEDCCGPCLVAEYGE